jgi:hypothetical protein
VIDLFRHLFLPYVSLLKVMPSMVVYQARRTAQGPPLLPAYLSISSFFRPLVEAHDL